MNKTVKHQIGVIFRDVTSLGGLSFFIFISVLVLALHKLDLLKELLLGFVITLAVVVMVRTFYFKDRPKKRNYSNYFERIEASSFPSLHSARVVFTIAVFVKYFNQIYATYFLIFMAALVCYSRIYLKKHDWVDITFGAILGYLTFFIVGMIVGII